MSSNATDHLRVLLLHVPHVRVVGWHVRMNLCEEKHDGMVEQSGDDGGALNKPDLRECGLVGGLVSVNVGHRMHSTWNIVVPRICPALQSLPFAVSVLPPHLLVSWVRLLKSWYRRSKVADLGNNV